MNPPAVPPLGIGIMQGRLLPPIDGRVQSFPRDGWEREFPLAHEIGFDSIELTIEMASWEIHPVRTVEGRRQLRRLSADNGIALAGLCCDTVMEHPLTSTDAEGRRTALAMLEILINDSAEAGLPMIELPLLGASSLDKAPDRDAVGAILTEACVWAEAANIDILLETDLDGPSFGAFMDKFTHPRLGINYDMGNSHYLGFEPEEEIPFYAKYIRNAHIKDTTRDKYSVPLSQGNVKFNVVFNLLAEYGYKGGFILQAARQPDDIGAAQDYIEFSRGLIDCVSLWHQEKHNG